METKILKPILLTFSIFILFSFDVPKGWIIAGSEPKKYEMGIDKGSGQDGGNAATIKSTEKKIKGFGTLMQMFDPGKYLGKRIKMTAFVRSENVDDWAGLWLRVDQQGSNQALAFDNMQDRPVKGTTAWKKYEIVLDVPAKASNIAYGCLLSGNGQVWFDKFTFEILGEAKSKNGTRNMEPTNTDFDELPIIINESPR
ncbi:MAG: hypothetical protein EOP53_12735 [Sphingobacteriales bacterium]|nr:MAG: hypothetical protein EOP53_12735 [Sphingobacteriales bacterium]